MRKLMTVLSFVFGALTFAAVAFAGREGSNLNIVIACIPALLCIMTAIAGDSADGQHLDLDEADVDM